MEIFLVVFALGLMAEKFKVETAHAARGTTSPRWQRKLMEAERRGQPGYVPRYGSKDWCLDLWGDFLQDRTNARRAAASKPDASFAERAREVVRAERERRAREVAPVAAPVTPQPEPQTVNEPCDGCGTTILTVTWDADALRSYCVDCRKRRAPTDADVRPDYVPTPIPDPDVADANVIPIFRKHDHQQEEDMTSTISNEVTGLDPAIAYADAVAVTHEQHGSAGAETFVNGLADRGVGQETLAMVRDAQASSGIAAEKWRAVSAALANANKPVQQAYADNPEAGDRKFQEGGR